MANPHRHPAAAALALTPFFSRLDDETRSRVAAHAQCRRFNPGDIVFREGEVFDGLFVIQDGWFKVVKYSPDGREQTLHVLGPGRTFSGLNLFVDAQNPATVIALAAAVAWELPRTIVLDLLRKDPDLAWGIIQTLAAHLQHLTELVADLSLRTVESRLARLLLEQAENGIIDRQRWATIAEIAARLGTVPDVLSRALRQLEENKLIAVERRQIQIIDPARLAEKAT